MLVPTSVFQLAAVLLLMLPGIVYTAVRRRLVGPTPEDQAFSVRLTRALAVSVVFDIAYVLIAGPWLVDLLSPRPGSNDALSGLTNRPRVAAAVALLLLIVVPTAIAALGQLRLRKPLLGERPLALAPVYHPTPSAWDQAALERGGAFVRVFTEDGHWVGGWLGAGAYVSTYPQPRDLFIDEEWKLGPAGDFLERVPDSLGVFVPLTGKERVAWISAPADQTTPPRLPVHRRLLSRLWARWRRRRGRHTPAS
ncbi:DUF6338 family protein [Geodermatophilus aquaeductus]|uniref:Uncharacterized protein n=1 Tax=Geodermatophilus aquaeductus TaxID=1564161 RepID=A0A521F7U0_9ACTN|nr:DUF6338 family protein [Geodermatophilus aquaeductus]SMO92233.1 hypothetical protein SAMN06273567_107165 [Geodermatophilus aquaeductus]